jgi:hypothetical protein
MSRNQDSERERLQRIRDRQIRDRDPGPRVKVEWKGDAAKTKQEPVFKLIWGALPRKAKGTVVGLFLGMLGSLAMGMLMPYPWNMVCGAIFFLVAIGVGTIVGASTDQGGYID